MDAEQQQYTESGEQEQRRAAVEQASYEAWGRFEKGVVVLLDTLLKALKSLIKAMYRQLRGR